MSSEDYARECCLRGVAQACTELGFDSAEDTALEAIADAVRYFLTALGQRAHANMTHARRSRPELHDMLAALRQAPSAATSWATLAEFAALKDGAKAGADDAGWRVPGAVAPPLPMPKRHKTHHFAGISLDAPTPRSPHVPSFMPPFPPLEKKRKKKGKEDDAPPEPTAAERLREREALQLALNRMRPKGPARNGSVDAPLLIADE